MKNELSQSETLIVGGGIAGITTAIELLHLGKKVTLIDRDSEDRLGGLAKISFGGMFFVDSPQQKKNGINDSTTLAYEDWCKVAGFSVADQWPKAWAKFYVENCRVKVQKWLQNKGVKFFPVVHWVERGLANNGNRQPRFHMVWGTGHELVMVLVKALRELAQKTGNLTLKFHHRVDSIMISDGIISGVKGVDEKSKKVFELFSHHLVIASGGMGGNIEQIKKHWRKDLGSPPETILNGLRPEIDGKMLDQVQKVKGKLTHLDKMWPYAAGVHHPRPSFKGEGLSLVPPKSALWLNFKGERIGPEPLVTGYDTRFLVEQVCKQEKKYSWQVLNLKIAQKEFAISGAEFNPAIRDKKWLKFIWTLLRGNKALVDDMMTNCPDFVVADSVDELAKEMNGLMKNKDVDPEGLKKTIKAYDSEIEKGPEKSTDIQIQRIKKAREYRGDKVRTCNFQKINDPQAYPLIAIREYIVSRKTLGGIQTDLSSRVLDVDGEVIEGLFAVGEAAGFGGGGMHGKGALEGTFLGGCILTGRAAAYAIAQKELTD